MKHELETTEHFYVIKHAAGGLYTVDIAESIERAREEVALHKSKKDREAAIIRGVYTK